MEDKHKIIIGSARQIYAHVSTLSVDSQWHWCYFGIDISRKESIGELFTEARRRNYAKELHKLTQALKQPFLDWVGKINSHHENDLVWWATRFPSKSPFQTDFFLFFSYFNLIKQWLNRLVEFNDPLMVIVEDPFLHKMLEDQLSSLAHDSVFIKSSSGRMGLFKLQKYLQSARIYLVFVKIIIASLIFNILKKKDIKKFKDIFNARVMIYTWIEKRSFHSDSIRDVYLGDISQFYLDLGQTVAVGCQSILPWDIRRKSVELGKNHFIPGCYLSFGDWMKALFSKIPFMPDKDLYYQDGIDYSLLFSREYYQEIASLFFKGSLIEHFAYKRYFGRNKDLRLFIYPFENQPWEKMVILALSSSRPEVVTVGYQHSVIPPMLMNYFLGKDEYVKIPRPDYIITNGFHYHDVLTASGFGNTIILNGGSLRYSGFNPVNWEKSSGRVNKNILFLLMASLPYSLELIYAIRKLKSSNYKYKVFVKPHPDLFNKAIINALSKFKDVEIILSKSMRDILPEMDLVVHSGTTAALEAFYYGVPVFKLDSELIDLDILDELEFDQYRADENGSIDLDEIFEKTADNQVFSENVLSEPMRKEVWASLLNA